MAEHERARLRGLGRQALQTTRAADAICGQLPDVLSDRRRRGRKRVVVVRLDPHHPRRLDGAEADREDRPERDRHLAEELSRVTDTDRAVDPVDEPGRLDLALEDGEERPLVPLVRSELSGAQADVGRDASRRARERRCRGTRTR